MKKLFSVLVASVLSTASFFTTSISNNGFNASATSANVLLGDANGSGSVNVSDAVCILQFLAGRYTATPYCFTAMDVNDDKVVDKTDSFIIQYRDAHNIPSTTRVQKELYTVPNNESRRYIKYNCSTMSTSYYTLSPSEMSGSSSSMSLDDEDISLCSSDLPDNENTNVVKVFWSGGYGSGFVINDHIIATAAHCVYKRNANSFNSNITVNVYNEQSNASSNNCVATFNASYIHIPENYKTASFGECDNYDYALIYVESDSSGNDLLDYVDAWDIGVPAWEFSSVQHGEIWTTGYPANQSGSRFYSCGNAIEYSSNSNESHNHPIYRLNTSASGTSGKSGGPMYYESSFSSNFNKSAVAVFTGGGSDGSWGCVMNTTLLNFYKRNPYT